MKMKVTTCCGCCSLQAGSLIIACLSTITGIVLTKLLKYGRFVMNDNEFYNSHSFWICTVIYIVISMVLSAMLIEGSYERKICYVVPYVYIGLVLIMMSIVCLIGYITFIFRNSEALNEGVPIPIIGFTGVMPLQIYFWLVVYSFYQELKVEQFEYPPNNTREASLI